MILPEGYHAHLRDLHWSFNSEPSCTESSNIRSYMVMKMIKLIPVWYNVSVRIVISSWAMYEGNVAGIFFILLINRMISMTVTKE